MGEVDQPQEVQELQGAADDQQDPNSLQALQLPLLLPEEEHRGPASRRRGGQPLRAQSLRLTSLLSSGALRLAPSLFLGSTVRRRSPQILEPALDGADDPKLTKWVQKTGTGSTTRSPHTACYAPLSVDSSLLEVVPLSFLHPSDLFSLRTPHNPTLISLLVSKWVSGGPSEEHQGAGRRVGKGADSRLWADRCGV